MTSPVIPSHQLTLQTGATYIESTLTWLSRHPFMNSISDKRDGDSSLTARERENSRGLSWMRWKEHIKILIDSSSSRSTLNSLGILLTSMIQEEDPRISSTCSTHSWRKCMNITTILPIWLSSSMETASKTPCSICTTNIWLAMIIKLLDITMSTLLPLPHHSATRPSYQALPNQTISQSITS